MKIHVDAPALGFLFMLMHDVDEQSIISTPHVVISSGYNSNRLMVDLYVGDQQFLDIDLTEDVKHSLSNDGITIA